MNEIKLREQTPEQLMKLLDSQLAAKRARHSAASQRRTAVRVFGAILIVGLCLAAFLILQYVVTELPPRNGARSAIGGEIEVR